MALTASMENYLKVICKLAQKHGTVHCMDIAREMSVTLPSVSRAVKELAKMQHIIRGIDGSVCLTASGEKITAEICERHLFFTEQLIAAGVDPKTAAHDACGIEHVISAESFQKLKKTLET